MRIFDPYGREYVSIASFADRELTLPVAGTYTLLIEGRVWSTGANDDYGFALNRMQDPAPLALTLGERVDGALAGAGDVQRYRFALTTETLLSRSEEHTSELQSLMRISYAVFCLQKKNKRRPT